MKRFKQIFEIKNDKKKKVDIDKIATKTMNSSEAEKFLKRLQTDIKLQDQIEKQTKKVIDNFFDLTPKRIKEPGGFKRSKNKTSFEERQGKCYEFAAKTIWDNPKWMLIHGTLIPPIGSLKGLNYAHAWAEKGNILYDPSHDGFYKKKEYYKKYKVKDTTEFNDIQMNINLLKFGHWGDWK